MDDRWLWCSEQARETGLKGRVFNAIKAACSLASMEQLTGIHGCTALDCLSEVMGHDTTGAGQPHWSACYSRDRDTGDLGHGRPFAACNHGSARKRLVERVTVPFRARWRQ